MITYEKLSRRPGSAPSLIGMPLVAFDKLYAEFEPIHHQRLRGAGLTRRTKTPRRRAVGAGRRHDHDLRDRLLMTLFWLRVYTTYEVLAFFYDLDMTNIRLVVY